MREAVCCDLSKSLNMVWVHVGRVFGQLNTLGVIGRR